MKNGTAQLEDCVERSPIFGDLAVETWNGRCESGEREGERERERERDRERARERERESEREKETEREVHSPTFSAAHAVSINTVSFRRASCRGIQRGVKWTSNKDEYLQHITDIQ